MQGAASVSNGLQHEPKTNGKIISSSTKNSDLKNSDQNSNQNSNELIENEEQWDWCKGLPPKSSEAFWQKKNASAYILPKENLMTKVFNYYQKKPTLSPNYIHMYKNSRKMCALSAGACYFGKNKKYSKLWCYEKIAWIFIVYN